MKKQWVLLTLAVGFIFLLALNIFQYNENKKVSSNEKIPQKLEQSNLFCFKGEFFNGSCLTAMDINKDGKEEIIYQPKGASWNNLTYVLKESNIPGGAFELLCKNCTFTSYSSYPTFKDVNGDGFVDVSLVVSEADQDNKLKKKTYNFINNDFVLTEERDE